MPGWTMSLSITHPQLHLLDNLNCQQCQWHYRTSKDGPIPLLPHVHNTAINLVAHSRFRLAPSIDVCEESHHACITDSPLNSNVLSHPLCNCLLCIARLLSLVYYVIITLSLIKLASYFLFTYLIGTSTSRVKSIVSVNVCESDMCIIHNFNFKIFHTVKQYINQLILIMNTNTYMLSQKNSIN